MITLKILLVQMISFSKPPPQVTTKLSTQLAAVVAAVMTPAGVAMCMSLCTIHFV